METKITKLENELKALIATTKKTMDSNINTIQRGLLDKIDALNSRVTNLEEENKKIKEERDAMKEEYDILKNKMASFNTREEGEIGHDLEDIRAELKREWVETVKEEVKVELEAKQEGWVEVVKKRLRVESKEEMTQEAQKKEQALARFRIINTLEEEKMRQARRLNIKVSGLKETPGSTPEEDGRKLCTILGYKEEDPLPFAQAWRAGKDLTRERSLILHFAGEEARTTFIKKRVILRDLKEGDPIYLDEDLTKMQRDHRFSCMPQIRAARATGKKATYRDGHVIIDGKVIE